MTASAGLEKAIDNLWATPAAPLPFMAGVSLRAFLLQRETGNLIVYNAPGLGTPQVKHDIARLGGVQSQLINHGHEEMFGPADLGAAVYVHERDRAEAATSLPIAGTFTERRKIDDDV